MSTAQNLFKFVRTIGVQKGDPFPLSRRKEFFNTVTLLGAILSIPQGISAFPFDFYAGLFHLTWGTFCLFALFAHHYINFTSARFLTCFSLFLFGNLAAARLGHESVVHIGSLTVYMSVFIMYDLKKEWKWIVFYTLLEIGTILLVESNYLKSPSAPDIPGFWVRGMSFIGTLLFIAIEFIYFIQMSLRNEQFVNQQLRETNLILNLRNQEKDLLIKEIHHRVKNNLQIISSLLRLQSHEIADPEAKEKFLDSVNRIKSISNLHETIYQSENLFNIDMNGYLQNLASTLIESYAIQKEIKLTLTSELVNVQNDYIVPISLILNEMISNSLKHGFSNQDQGEITVSIVRMKEMNHYLLEYSDNGSWVPSTQDDTFGIELIQSLVDQLNGVIKRQPNELKSEYSIQFEIAEANRI